MSRVWDRQTETHTEKLILLCLADCASDEGVCWPSYGTIARKCQMERSRVIEIIARFEKQGLLKKKSNKAANGHPSSNRYTLNIADSALEGGGAPRAPRVVPQQHQGSAPRAPTLEPSLEPSDRRGGKPPKFAALPKSEKPRISDVQRISYERELERIRDSIRTIEDNYGGLQTWCGDDLQKHKILKARRNHLRNLLDQVA